MAQTREWAALHPNTLNAGERIFLEKSINQEQQEEKERDEQRQRELDAARKLAETESRRSAEQLLSARNLRRLAVGLAIFLVAAIGAAWFALNQKDVAQKNFAKAEAQRLAAVANSLLQEGGNPEQIALLSLRSMNSQYTPQGDDAVVAAASLNIPRRLFVGHSAPVRAAVFSPDGKYMLTGSWDNTARLWDVQTGKEVRQFIGHTANIWTVEFSPDGRYVLTGSWDETSRLWDAQTGKEIHQFTGGGAYYMPDGKVILTNGDEAQCGFGM